MMVFVLSLAVVAVAMLIMSVGLVLGNRCLRGSCGGPELLGPDGQPLTCPTCPNRNGKAESSDTVPEV